MSYPATSYDVTPTPEGRWIVTRETWFVNLRGEKDWRCDVMADYPTEGAATLLRGPVQMSLTPNEIRDRAREMLERSAGLRRDMLVVWDAIAAVVHHDNRHKWPPLARGFEIERFNTARLAMLTAIVEGRRGEAKADALRAVGLEPAP